MNWEKFKNKFHKSWHKGIRPFIESEECDEIFKFLKSETRGELSFPEGLLQKKIAPASINTFKAFMTPLDEIKCLIIGGPPYSEFVNEQSVATGLLLDCSITEKVTPELRNFYEGIETEYYKGLNLDYIQEWNLEYLTERGVMLLNSSLTVEKDNNGGHELVWEPFIRYMLEEIIGYTMVPILFIGPSYNHYKNIVEQSNYVYHLPALSGIGVKWDTKDTFAKINEIIEGNDEESIMWLNIDVPF